MPTRDGEKRTRLARLDVDFADGHYAFRLAFRELIELDELLECGPFDLLNRLHENKWRVREIREVIRIGLIGGGTEPGKALALVRRYVEEVPNWVENAMLARAILMAALAGIEVEDPGKSPAAEDTAPASATTDASPSPPSTPPPPSPASSAPN